MPTIPNVFIKYSLIDYFKRHGGTRFSIIEYIQNINIKNKDRDLCISKMNQIIQNVSNFKLEQIQHYAKVC